ncbi:vicilin-like seed storage protein At2g18540 [Prunus persica]|uniref:vicilin-like seed storage protein At2g18540 n=1 Tax=Prunus persica TaxID=3760 RepID=UPI0009AB900A|nr:vicilin-like seed storage protein At2g18540 [Prunus persica]
MAQRIKTKPKSNYDRKAKHPDYVQFRCNAYAFNSIIRDIKDKLNERQKKLLKKTPFWNLIELFYHQRIDMNNMNKSDIDLAQLLKKFDPDTKSFKFGTKSFQITSNAVTQILGLPNEGKSVKLVNDRYTATFRTRHFGEKGKPSKNQKLFEHCVNLDTLSSYSWARAVSAYMNESLTAKAKAKAKKGGEASIGAVSGCTILILFLLCERTNIIQPILGKEKETPAILKWSLVELHTRFNQIKDLNDIEGIFKTPKKRKTTREEEDTVEKGILKTYKKRKTTGEEGDPLDKEKEKEDDEGKPDDAIQDLLVKSMTDQINYRQQQDPSFVCPERLQLWKDEKNEDSEKKMKELWDIFIQAEKRSKELEVELATYIEKLDNEECVTATMTVESTVQLNEIQNLKRRIAELEGKETGIDMEKIAKKKEIQGKYKAEIESLLSDPTIFEMEMDLPTQPVEEKEEEKKEEEKQQEEREEENKEQEKQQEEREEEKKQDAPTPDVPSRVQRVKNRERKRLQASCYVYEKNKKTKKEAKKDDEELPQFKLISSEEVCNYCSSSCCFFLFSALQKQKLQCSFHSLQCSVLSALQK